MLILGLHLIDILIIFAALLGILSIGIISSRKVKGENDFFVGGRNLGAVLQFFMFFGNATDSNGAPSTAGSIYRQGASGLWLTYQPIFLTPFYWFSGIWWRRSRLVTAPDQFIERFNSKKLAIALALWGLIAAPLGMAMGNIISYKVAAAMFVKPEKEWTATEHQKVEDYREYKQLNADFKANKLAPEKKERLTALESRAKRGEIISTVSYFTPLPFYLGYTAVVLLCILFGGIEAAAYTDILQGLLIIAFSVIMVPIGLHELGGMAGLHARLPPNVFDLFGAAGFSEYTWYSVVAFCILGVVTIGNPQGCGSARSEQALRVGMLGGAFAKRLVMIAWLFAGLIALAIFGPGTLADTDMAWGALSYHLLGPGLLGLMIAGLLLGHMPAVGFAAINFSATFARNVYAPVFPGRKESHYMLVARLAIIGVLLLGVLFALFFDGIEVVWTTLVSIGAFFGAMGLLMIFWRRLTAVAVGTGWILWMILLLLIPFGLPRVESLATHPSLTIRTQPKAVQATVVATADDVKTGLAKKTGDKVVKTVNIPQAAVFFDSVAPATPERPARGFGRFYFEVWLMHKAGLPVTEWNRAQIKTSTYLFQAFGPFLLLILLTYALPHRKRSGSSDVMPPEEYAKVVMEGNINLVIRKDETAEQEKIRLDRFFAKLKTPVAATPEEDEKEIAKTFADPSRFDKNRLFPRALGLEFTRWTWSDILGFAACWGLVGLILWFLSWILKVGS